MDEGSLINISDKVATKKKCLKIETLLLQENRGSIRIGAVE